jgi:DNA-binding transcriptional regulator YdaS (Cro superfamily)
MTPQDRAGLSARAASVIERATAGTIGAAGIARAWAANARAAFDVER